MIKTPVHFAAECIKRLGFVVVQYHEGRYPVLRSQTRILWRLYKMPQPFVVVGEATEDEWRAMLRLYRDLYGTEPQPEEGIGKPFLLVTD